MGYISEKGIQEKFNLIRNMIVSFKSKGKMKIKYWLVLTLCLVLLKANSQDYLGLESAVPANWTASNNGLHMSSLHAKMGNESIKWDWIPSGSITIDNPDGMANACKEYKGGMMLWIYNDNAKDADLKFEFMNSNGTIQYHFKYHIDFTGWRACWIRFDEDMQGIKSDKNLVTLKITAPSTNNGGTLYFDRMIFPDTRINDRVTPDKQLPEINPTMKENHWAALWYWYSNYDFQIELKSAVSTEEAEAFAEIRQRITNSVKGKALTDAQITKVQEKYNELNLRKENGIIYGPAYVAYDEVDEANGDQSHSEISSLMYDIAKGWHHHRANGFDQMFIDILDWLYDQGLTVGSCLGTNHHYGYQFNKYPKAIWLMKEVLKEKGCFEPAFQMIQFWMGVQEVRQLPEYHNFQGMVDAWNTIIPGRLMAIMMRDDSPELLRDIESNTAWMNAALQFSDGVIGGLKPDGSCFHHYMIYPAYANGGFAGLGQYFNYVGGTKYNLSEEARNNFRNALELQSWYCNYRAFPNGLAGRHPIAGEAGTGAINALGYLAKAYDPIDHELGAEYLRLARYKLDLYNEIKALGVEPSEAPVGNRSANYGALNLHRRDNWLVAIKGFNKNVIGTEIYSANNRYGRYQGYGGVQILASGDPVTAASSGFVLEGWDWNRFPGTTTIHLPYDLLDAPYSQQNEFSQYETFAGACSLDGNGIFGMKLRENNYTNYTSDFVARKSVFAFDNRIICLGTGINNSNKASKTETTLFQTHLENDSEVLLINNEGVTDFPLRQELRADEHVPITLLDTKGNGYYIPEGKVNVYKMQQESRHQKNRSTTSGNFASAWIDHGTSPKDKEYEYSILVQSSGDELEEFKNKMQSSDQRPYTVIRKDNKAHVVYDKVTKTYGFVLFEPNSKVSKSYIAATNYPCLVMVKEQAVGEIKLAIADPAINMSLNADHPKAKERRIKLTLNGRFELKEESEACRIIYSDEFKTEIEFTCIHGLSVEVSLLGILKTGIDNNEKVLLTPIIYPNPTNGLINIEEDQSLKSIQVLDGNGGIVRFLRVSEKAILLTGLPDGIYYLHLLFASDKKRTVKIIKMK